MEYFGTYNSIDELKKDFDDIVGSDLINDKDAVQEIKEQFASSLYSLSFKLGIDISKIAEKVLPAKPEEKKEEPVQVVVHKENEDVQEILEKIKDYNMKIEVIGSWIWCFNSYEYKDQLKELGFWYSGSKKAWVYNGQQKKYRRGHNLSETKKRYATKVIKEDEKDGE